MRGLLPQFMMLSTLGLYNSSVLSDRYALLGVQ